jgi:cytochrome c oxidase subunit II
LAPWSTLRRLVATLAPAALALAVFAAPAQATIFGPRASHSPNAHDIRIGYWVALIVAVVLIVAVHLVLAAAILRFRARRGRTPRRFAAGPGAFVRPAVPLVGIAIGLFVFGIVMASKTRNVQGTGTQGLGAQSDLVAQVNGLTVPPDTKPLDINVIGQRWLWRFEYPGGRPGDRTFSYNQLVVPVDTLVVLHVTSTDVLHRWFIPALGGQVDAIPGRDSETWLRADREGTYRGQSTEFSGTSYAVMRAWVKVVSPQAYQQFVKQKRKQLTAAQAIIQKSIQKSAAPGAALP